MTPPTPQSAASAPAPAQSYPLPPADDDRRFTIGLALDVAEVLEAHGYPRPTGLDLVDVQQSLFRLLYVGDRR